MPFALHRPPSFVIVLRMARLKTSARKTSPATDVLLMATPTKNADLRWFSGFHASDPFPAFSIGGRKVGLLPLLEVGRAKQESALDEVLNLTEIINDLRQTNPTAGVPDAIVFAAVQRGVHRFRVPADFPAGLFVRLGELGLELTPVTGALFPHRWVKSKAELEHEEFMTMLGRVMDRAKEMGVSEELFINPLTAMMVELSTNALEHHK